MEGVDIPPGATEADAGDGAVFDRASAMPGHLLRRCQQIAVSLFLTECRAFDLTPLQFTVLATLSQMGPQDQASICGYAALDRTTVGVVVKKLEARGLVRREVSAKDRRSKPISITAAGANLLKAAMPAVEEAQARMLGPLSATEQERFLRYLRKMADGNNSESRAPMRG